LLIKTVNTASGLLITVAVDENEEDEISNEHVNRIEESVDQNDYTGTLTDTVASEIGKCESENDDVEVNVANQDQSHTASVFSFNLISKSCIQMANCVFIKLRIHY
jgi:hypothetical protein